MELYNIIQHHKKIMEIRPGVFSPIANLASVCVRL